MTFLTNGPMGIKLRKPLLLGIRLTTSVELLLAGRRAMLVAARWCVCAPHRCARTSGAPSRRCATARRLGLHGRVGLPLQGATPSCISAGLAGLAGGLFAYSEQYISPNNYNFELTVLFLLAVIMGGRKSPHRPDARRGDHRAAAQPAGRHRAVPLHRRRHRAVVAGDRRRPAPASRRGRTRRGDGDPGGGCASRSSSCSLLPAERSPTAG